MSINISAGPTKANRHRESEPVQHIRLITVGRGHYYSILFKAPIYSFGNRENTEILNELIKIDEVPWQTIISNWKYCLLADGSKLNEKETSV